MHRSRFTRLTLLLLTLLAGFSVLIGAAAADPGNGKDSPPADPASFRASAAPQLRTPAGTIPVGLVLETFPNTWHVSSVGLTYDPVDDSVWYAHEGSASDPNTIWNIDRPSPHPTIFSRNLSALNPGFPVALNDRDGAAYDPAAQTFFLTDFQGDLVNRDDNIVEINRAGIIQNAWELDGASNDSSDATLVNTVIDIAIKPGTPNRYWVLAAEGSGLVREIALTRGGWWTPNTWNTVATCTAPAGLGDLVGIDYDAARDQLVVSSFNNEVLTYLNFDCTVEKSFICDGGAAANTGVTVIPGTFPREFWVTNFNSNSTTRCAEPLISLDKTVGTDSGTCAAGDSIAGAGYAIATYCYTVTNLTDDVTFGTHTLTDTELGVLLNDFPFALAPGASAFLTATELITQSTVNTATWEAASTGGPTALARDRATVAITPAGVCTYYASTNVPVTIASNAPNVVTSTLTVADAYALVDANVYLTATHTWDSDLIFTLIAPDNSSVQLINTRGGSGDNFTGTVLDDHAATPIAAGAPPFTGRFIPEQSLSALNGDQSNGTYRLRIEDTATGDGGSLNAWGVELCRAPDAEITLDKTVGTTAGVCATTDTITVTAGTTVHYCYTVTNTGEFTLPMHDLTDTELGALFTDALVELAPGDSISTVDLGMTITDTLNVTTVNTATWTADIDGQLLSTDTDSATVNVTTPTAVDVGAFSASSRSIVPGAFALAGVALLAGVAFALRRR